MIRLGSSCVTLGEGVIACGVPVALIRTRRECWRCRRGPVRAVEHLTSSPYYAPIVSFECGDKGGYEEGCYPRPFARFWQRDAQKLFERLWADAYPEGSRGVRDDNGYLVGVRLSDGGAR